MNTCFRYVKPRYLDIRKLSYSIVTSLKEPEQISKVQGSICLDGFPDIDVGNTDRVLPSADPVTPRKLCRQELQKSLEVLPNHQKLELEYLIDKQWGLVSSVIKQNHAADYKKPDVVRASNISNKDLKSYKLEFNKCSHLSQKESLSPKEKDISERNYNSNGGRRESSGNPDRDGPTHAQLQKVARYYEDQILAMHAKSEDFSQGLHSKNIIFENNYTKYPASCQGIDKYRMALAKMRILGNLSYVTYRFHLVAIRLDMEEGTVTAHWRLYYINNIRFFTHTAPRVLLDRGFKNAYDEDEAISTFYVNSDGQITKHKVDKTIPLKEGEKKKVESILSRLRKKMNLAVT